MQLRKPLLAGATALGALLFVAGPAAAHVSPTPSSAPAGSFFKFDLGVGHGCGEDGNTSSLAVQIPKEITSVTPQVVPGWTIERTMEKLDEPLDDGHGGQITERTSVITWTGGPLAHDQLQEFGLSVKLPDAAGTTIYFPTIQSCDNDETGDWIQIPEAGGEEPEMPAPAIELTASTGDDHGSGDTATSDDGSAGDDDSSVSTTPSAEPAEGESAAASDSTTDDDDSNALGLAGVALGAVGIAVGGVALARTRRGA